MSTPNKLVNSIELSVLICSLYTLYQNNRLFKKLILKNDLYLSLNSKDHFSNKEEIFTDLYTLLNNVSLRRFVFKLLKPIFKAGSFSKTANEISKNETFLLKKYLNKFKHNYYHYFFYQTNNFDNTLTEREINLYAIKILFLIVGI